MWKFTIRRFLIMIPQIIVLSVIVFLAAQAMPGDALSGQIDPNIDQSAIQEQREKLGLNDPWPQKYVRWVDDLFHGDLGKSMVHKMPVTELIGQRMINTVWLSLLTTILSCVAQSRSEEHTSELQSRFDLVCRLLLEKKKDHETQHDMTLK